MIIDDSEALMKWLSAILEPMCDADPTALSKYVLALIKKDKAESELRDSMEQQMEVFLQDNTGTFIDSLFTTLSSKDYLNGPPPKVAKKGSDDEEEVKNEEEKPDSTTSTPRDLGELSSELKEADNKSRRTSEENRSRRRSPRDRKPFGSPRRRSSGHRGRYRSRSRSPNDRRGSPHRRLGRRGGSPYGRRSRSRSRSYSRSPHRRYGSPPRDEEPYNPSAIVKRQRCRDYDEKGFCLKGDQCKFDHGNDAVVLEDNSTTSIPPPAYLPGSYTEPYVPASTLPPLHLPPPGYSEMSSRKRSYDDSGLSGYPPGKRFDYNRLGGRRGRGGGGVLSRPGGAREVLVKSIPPSLNTIAHLNNHFARFGTLRNVQIHYEGDPASALVSFTHPHEATAAMNCSDAVLGNRFIKMFYHHEKGNVKERLGGSGGSPNEKVIMDGKTITKTIVNNAGEATPTTVAPIETPEEAAAKEVKKAAEIAAIKKNQEVMETKIKMKKQADVKKAEVLKKSDEIRKSKQDLLDKLIDEQKKILKKMEDKKATITPEEKKQLMALIKSIQSSIAKAKEDLKQIISQQNTRKSFSDLQKELLDAELELFNAQQDGAENIEEIQKRVNILKLEAVQKGFSPTSRHPRGRGAAPPFRGFRGYPRVSPRGSRGGFRGGRGLRRGRANYMQQGRTSLDRRPTSINIAEVEEDEKEKIIEHMAKFGEVAETIDDEDNGCLVIQYKSRREAELAIIKAKQFNNKELKLTWQLSVSGETVDAENEESEHSGLDDHSEFASLDDYTPLDPTYLPPGLEEDENKPSNEKDDEEEEEEVDEESASWKRKSK